MQALLLSLPWQDVPAKGTPMSRFVALGDAMLKHSVDDGKCVHYHYQGSWLSLVSEIMASDPTSLHFTLFRDEFLDAKGAPLGKAGKWLRRRTDQSGATLTLKTSIPSHAGVSYQETRGESAISEALVVKDVESTYPIVVAWYDCLRLSHTSTEGTVHFELARLGTKMYYLLATTTLAASVLSASVTRHALHPLHSRSKTLEALHYQNDKYYQWLLSTGAFDPEPPTTGSSPALMNQVDPSFQSLFDTFAESLMAAAEEYL